MFAAIDEERIRQRSTWKGHLHAIQHHPEGVLHLITSFLGQAQEAAARNDLQHYRFLLLQAATLAVAALEPLEPPSPTATRDEGGPG